MNIAEARREVIRRISLDSVDGYRPVPVSDQLLLMVLSQVCAGITITELRRELDYLRLKGWLTIAQTPGGGFWLLGLTSQGIDFITDNEPPESVPVDASEDLAWAKVPADVLAQIPSQVLLQLLLDRCQA